MLSSIKMINLHNTDSRPNFNKINTLLHITEIIILPSMERLLTTTILKWITLKTTINISKIPMLYIKISQGVQIHSFIYKTDSKVKLGKISSKKFIPYSYVTILYNLVQLILTAGMCCASLYSKTYLVFQIENYWLMWVCFGFMIVSEITIFCFPAGRKHPINVILLTIFTIC
jgi:hypothetical protein